MYRLLAAFLVAAPLAIGSAQSFAQGLTASRAIVIEQVTVIDVETGASHVEQTVIISGNRITAVQPTARAHVPAGARIVDGRGKFLIPGLWDMHVHALQHYGIEYDHWMEALQLFVANGVTGIRDMGSSLGQLLAGKRRIESQRLVAPRIFGSGPLLETAETSRYGTAVLLLQTPDEGRRAVDSLAVAGVDFLKIHDGLSRETYFAIAAEAKRKHMSFAGHVPEGITLVEASDAGQRSIEHLASLAEACTDEAEPRTGQVNQPLRVINGAKCDSTLSRLARNGTFLTPTLLSSVPLTVGSPGAAESRLRYIKPIERGAFPRLAAEESQGARARHEFNELLTRAAAAAKVTILAGTDTGAPYRLPGWALQDELGLLVDAGLSPLEALRSATLNPALYFNMQGSLGTIAPGKLADLLLLDGDPLADIHNTSRIAAVIANGRLFDATAIQSMLDDVLASAHR